MKFLFELVPCFVPQPYDTSATAEQPRDGEMQSHARPSRRRKRVRVVNLPGNSVEWKPSLNSISEDKAVVEKPRAAGERQIRRKGRDGGGGSKSRSHVRNRSDDFWTDPYETAIPAFAPTPFIV